MELVYHSSSIYLASESEGYDCGVQIFSQSPSSTSRSIIPLPPYYTNVPPSYIKTKEFTAPAVGDHVRPDTLLNGQKKERSNGLPVLWQLSAKRNWTTQIGSPGRLIMQASKQMKFHLLQSMHCYHYSQRVHIQLP